ncbi:putative chaperone binding protein [Thozetella sp. PMI_491]|nr:putative chaperone binding protein [Thozetella sp. PMI_491]
MVLHNPNNWHWVNKDTSAWAKQWFEDNLTKIEAEEGDVSAKISKIISMDGDVDVSQRKGKVITIFDVKLTLEYSGSTGEEDDVSGTITVPEVAHDTEEDEFVFDIDIYSESKGKQPVKDLVRSKIVPQLRTEFLKLAPAMIAEHGKDIQHAPGSNPSSGFSTPKFLPQGSGAAQAAPAPTQTSSGSTAVNTTTVTESEEFRTTADELYKTFTDPQRIAAFTRAPPKLFEGAKKGGKFELFGGNVSGEYLELVEPTKIVQSWRLDQWPKGHYSKLQIEFDQNDVDSVTVMRVTWSGVPVGQEDVTKTNWDQYYVHSIKKTFGLTRSFPQELAVVENFDKSAEYIRNAAAQGCHLAVLPEYYLTSWCADDPGFIPACAESVSYLSRYQELARELNINIVPGTICEPHPLDPAASNGQEADPTSVIRLNGKPVEVRNMAYFICAGTGELAGTYQKKNLWHGERAHLAPGVHHPHRAFDTPLLRADGTPLRAGLLVCWDVAFPEAFRALISDGAELIIIPSYWTMQDVDPTALALNPDCERVFLSSALVSRAYENTCAVVFVNKGGLSQVAAPITGPLGGLMEPGEEGMKVVELDLDLLRIAEENYKVRQDIKGEKWHYGYELVKD